MLLTDVDFRRIDHGEAREIQAHRKIEIIGKEVGC
jgi:hypothetical protein